MRYHIPELLRGIGAKNASLDDSADCDRTPVGKGGREDFGNRDCTSGMCALGCIFRA